MSVQPVVVMEAGGVGVQPVALSTVNLAGDTFPSSPAAGQTWFRTDLGWWCFYDGAQWLTCHELVYATASTFQSDNGNTAIIPARSDYAPLITRVGLTRLVLTTNDGSNYWSITVRALSSAGGSTTTLRSLSTAVLAANTWLVDDADPAEDAPSPAAGFDVAFTKAGSPGTILTQATIHARLIIP